MSRLYPAYRVWTPSDKSMDKKFHHDHIPQDNALAVVPPPPSKGVNIFYPGTYFEIDSLLFACRENNGNVCHKSHMVHNNKES